MSKSEMEMNARLFHIDNLIKRSKKPMREVQVTVDNIKWDVDYDEDGENLPTEMQFSFEVTEDAGEEEVEEKISDIISDKVGFCHEGFEITEQIEYVAE